MDKYMYDENNGLWYELHGDYYLPCFTLSEEETQPIGIWGRKHLRYLKKHRKAVYAGLCASSNRANHTRFSTGIPAERAK